MPQFLCVVILESTDGAVNTIYRVFRHLTDLNPALHQMHTTP